MGYRFYLNKYSCILSTFNSTFQGIKVTIVRMIYNYIDKSAKLGVFLMKQPYRFLYTFLMMELFLIIHRKLRIPFSILCFQALENIHIRLQQFLGTITFIFIINITLIFKCVIFHLLRFHFNWSQSFQCLSQTGIIRCEVAIFIHPDKILDHCVPCSIFIFCNRGHLLSFTLYLIGLPWLPYECGGSEEASLLPLF